MSIVFTGKKLPSEALSPKVNSVFGEDGGIERRTIILVALMGLLGGAAAFIYKLLSIPGASDVLSYGSSGEKFQVLKSITTGEPLPSDLTERIQKQKGLRSKIGSFEAKLDKMRKREGGFMFAEKKLLKETFEERNAVKYLKSLRVYIESIYNEYRIKKNIPADMLAIKISEFPEKRIFPLICCCCGLPDDKGLNYMAYRIFSKGYAGLEGGSKERVDYYLKVIHSVIYLREGWYKNFFDTTRANPKKNEALETIWNFLNADELPQDLIKNREYFEES